MLRETLKPGETVHNSGIYQGSKSGERTTLVKGNMAPLMPMRHESLDRSRSDESATKAIACQGKVLSRAAPAVEHPRLSAQLARVRVAGVGLMIGSLLVEIAQDRGGAPAALPR